MDFDKLAEAMKDKELPKLFAKRAELRTKLDELDAQRSTIVGDMADTETAIVELVGVSAEPVNNNGVKRKCALCGEEGHISRNGKCRNFPNGKPQED